MKGLNVRVYGPSVGGTSSLLFLTLSLTVLLTGPDLFWGVEGILFCTCRRVQVRNTAALCGFSFLLADSRNEPPLRTQVGTSLCSHVVMCILISGCICEFACFTQVDTLYAVFFFFHQQ